ncbi:ATP-dependent helicase [Sulfolobus acidocaldarius]|uniref:ATP-dependent helicase Lhr-Core n=4 Tax=Sulfolobus acidocaldarius TaxID=2285 RepID=LHRC_SULAC|nr:ATP-dependent helicase [Sulfolobus acidocaldarius]AAY80821.1 putative ATP-dependent helicase [Sulfolobus acidocaldarius DSM 639]AGE71421.1 ATP-dependent helicase [Sulfolobus acidocaldarius N8]AGE73694.1 ATP-dependent helicase [Sulfolobus acidocaldarius Ron12/I]ALU30337.1 ATP-dependent helicase [Sulfolobus acidocaldarius]ALU31055.1 ATP-dependent helicase [Sulfolobus acidocaldarius]
MDINTLLNTPDEDVLSLFTPQVARWFKEKYKVFTPPQKGAIPLIKKGKNVLVSSPTGSGKTLAAFLGILDTLIDLGYKNELNKQIYAIYISPLRALNNDMRRNLIEPLTELRNLYPDLPEISIGVRTSDTSSYEKQKMLKKPPHILITTPESFGISLVSPKFREKLSDVKWVIVDEIHELANSKRGAYLAGLLELYKSFIAKNNFVRIGLSATISPLEEVAKFLVGGNGDYEIIDARFVKPTDIQVVSPVKDLVHATEEEVNIGIYSYLVDEIKKHKTTLIFTNTRHAAERVAYKLRKMFEDQNIFDSDLVAAHHSSLSRDVRLEVEEKLKRGELKVVVSSTSLELGIDIGYIDLVTLLSSPKSVSRLLQRVGRAGHHIREVSKGRVVVVDRDDLVECTVLAKLAIDRKIDNIHVPENPLDVLTQLIVAASLITPIEKDKLYEIIKNVYNFRSLSYDEYNNVAEYLAGNYGLDSNKVYAKIRIKDGMISPKRGTRMIFFLNSGTIPDEAMIPVKMENGGYVGNLEEEFVEILAPGDIFVLAGKTYEFIRSEGNSVIVKKSEGQRPTVPSWFSEMLPLAFDSAIEIGKFRGKIAEAIMNEVPKDEVISSIMSEYNLSRFAALSIYNYVKEELLFTGGIVPTDKLLLIEVYDDDDQNRNFIFHGLYGRRTVDALSRAIAYIISKDLNMDVRIAITDNGFAITVPGKQEYEISKVFDKLEPDKMYEILSDVILRTEMIKRRFRHCAERSFMLLKRYKGRETSIDRRQINSEVLLGVVRQIEHFPVLKETVREILEDYMDIKRAIEIVEKIRNGDIKVATIGPNQVPSPFAHNILVKQYTDVVLAEDKRELLKELHNKVIEFLRNKGIDIDLEYTEAGIK